VCVIGLQLSSVVLRALDRATGYDPDGGIGGVIFVAMAAQGNRVQQGMEARTMKQPDLVSDTNLYAATIAHNREKEWVWKVDVIPAFAEEQTATGQIMSNRYYKGKSAARIRQFLVAAGISNQN
jgi:hypothetical protein